MSNENSLEEQIAQLLERVAALEEKVTRLEGGNNRPITTGVTAAPAGDKDALVPPIAEALQQITEGDAGAIRQQLIKNGHPASLGRSDINKALYSRKDLFTVDRQEGAKPIWKLV